MAESERRYTMKEVASLTGVDERQVRRWEASGFLQLLRTRGGGERRGHRRITQQMLSRIAIMKALYETGRVRYRDLGEFADTLERALAIDAD